ncbi:NAD(P)/FAD-dependent oxidoreductase [Mycoplasmopsis felifaucium]|uniref:NAD(P)/FAD-dependent oxidoreductase n=1 Tax=Mycoplasmopsis felifaucium TaxID=35768 RepID=UPI0004862AF4|nr:FAD-dependent oxidoreductase [Mycoplasmopsis felifaucium]
MDLYDIIIIGGGPGGLNAALYASRAGLNTLVIEKELPGGKINTTSEVENLLGILSISGFELAEQIYKHALSFGAKYKTAEVININNIGPLEKEVILKSGEILHSKTIIIASGMVNRKPTDIKNFDKFTNKGISYCGVCDGPLYKDKNIFVLGGGNSAFEEADFMSQYANNVTMIVNSDKFSAEKIIVDKVLKNPKITIYKNSKIISIDGENIIQKISFIGSEGKIIIKDCDALFPMIGFIPSSKHFENLKITNSNGFIDTDEKMETTLKGIYAVGDIREKRVRQIITAASDGAIAAKEIWNILK